MSSVNKVILVGHLAADPEVRYTNSGAAVANFRIATNEVWNDKNSGNREEHTEWHRIVAWAKLGELCGEYLKKGRQVYIEGKLRTRAWQTKEGEKRYTTEVTANNVVFLGGKAAGQSVGDMPGAESDRSASSSMGQGPEGPPIDDYSGDSDVPF